MFNDYSYTRLLRRKSRQEGDFCGVCGVHVFTILSVQRSSIHMPRPTCRSARVTIALAVFVASIDLSGMAKVSVTRQYLTGDSIHLV